MLGRRTPLRSPERTYPFEPQTHGETDRDAPLPFQFDDPPYEIQQIMQIITSPTQPGLLAPGTCVPNLVCIPQAEVTKVDPPIATVRCSF